MMIVLEQVREREESFKEREELELGSCGGSQAVGGAAGGFGALAFTRFIFAESNIRARRLTRRRKLPNHQWMHATRLLAFATLFS